MEILKSEYRRSSFEELSLASLSRDIWSTSDELGLVKKLITSESSSFLQLPIAPGYSGGHESGYASFATTPENENPPFDWPTQESPLKSIVEDPTVVSESSDDEFDLNFLPCACPIEEAPEGETPKKLLFQNHPSISEEPDPSTLYSSQFITYKIDLGDTKINSISSIKSYIVAPCGKPIHPIREIDYLTSQLICKFKTHEHGIHTVIATWEATDLVGSPIHINIGRNYGELENHRPIVSVDLEIEDSGNRNHLLRKPWGITVDPRRETIYATDREHHEIIAYAPDGEHLFSFGTRGNEAGEFRRPTGIAFDPNHDRLYVTDKDNHRIQIFSPTGTYIGQFGTVGQERGEFFFPWGIAVSPDGNVIAIADSRNHRIQLLTKDGEFLRKFYPRAKRGTDGLTHAELLGWQYPRGICFDNSGEHLYVTDFNGHGIFKLHVSFTHYEKIIGNGQELRRPSGLTVDESGNILVCDHRNNAIKIYSPSGNLLNNLQTLGSSQIELPTDVAVMKGGHLVSLDCNGRIRII